MKEYSFKGFKVYYPDNLKIKGNYLSQQIYDPKSDIIYLRFGLNPSEIPFEVFAKSFGDYDSDNGHTIIRKGNYTKFPEALEVYFSTDYGNNYMTYTWQLLIPLKNRCMTVTLRADFPDANMNKAERLRCFHDVWVPIVESMKFDIDEIIKLPNYPAVEKNWTKISGKPKHFKQVISPGEGYVGLYDSGVGFYDEDDEGWATEIDNENVSAGFIKMDQRLIIFPRNADGSDLPVDFYIAAEAPEADKWFRVIEGLIGADSGKLCFGEENPDVIIKMQKGVYKFRVYFGMKGTIDDGGEYWRIYFWPTDEKETNDVKIIKNGKN